MKNTPDFGKFSLEVPILFYGDPARWEIVEEDWNGKRFVCQGNNVRYAALILAAPKMFELLERLSHALFAEDGDEWAAEIQSLLAKARGVVGNGTSGANNEKD